MEKIDLLLDDEEAGETEVVGNRYAVISVLDDVWYIGYHTKSGTTGDFMWHLGMNFSKDEWSCMKDSSDIITEHLEMIPVPVRQKYSQRNCIVEKQMVRMFKWVVLDEDDEVVYTSGEWHYKHAHAEASMQKAQQEGVDVGTDCSTYEVRNEYRQGPCKFDLVQVCHDVLIAHYISDQINMCRACRDDDPSLKDHTDGCEGRMWNDYVDEYFEQAYQRANRYKLGKLFDRCLDMLMLTPQWTTMFVEACMKMVSKDVRKRSVKMLHIMEDDCLWKLVKEGCEGVLVGDEGKKKKQVKRTQSNDNDNVKNKKVKKQSGKDVAK
jgi:hypothetical protein